MKLTETTIAEKNIYKGKVIELNIQEVELPNKKIANREIVKHPGGVAVLAYEDKDTILMVQQFRKAIDKGIYEIPAGKLEYGEDIEACGRRELEEETGYKAEKFTYLGKIVTSPGFCNEYIYLYKAEELYKGELNTDEDEFINVIKFKVDTVKEMIKRGDIIDAKSICAFMMI
ncbi:MAG: NUDIX hydrolase [Bacillota bacterium]|nr:NUDIX hydrolase [Bacillota bacterium]